MKKGIAEANRNQFLQAGQAGHHSLWRYLVTFLIIVLAVFSFNIFTSIAIVTVTGTTDLNSMPPVWVFLLAMSTFPPAAIALLFCVQSIHGRRIKTLITPQSKPNLKWLWTSSIIWLVLSLLGDLFLAFVATPGNYQFTFNPGQFIVFALLALFLLPIQTSTEELFFRSYLLQGLSRMSRSVWIPVLLSSLAFAALHIANPEVAQYGFWTMMVFYFGIGLLLAWVTLYTEGLEAALGLHLANNVYAALFVTFPGSALNTPAVFSMKDYFPVLSLAVFLVLAVLYALIIRRIKRSWLTQSEDKEI
jgi:membrane protease YdiL (CAAX protease family)